VASVLSLSLEQVRALAEAGSITPAPDPQGEERFSFRDLVLLRSLKGLDEARIPRRRVRRALAKLKKQLPEERPLGSIALTAEAEGIIARDDKGRWNPESGQFELDFQAVGPQQVPFKLVRGGRDSEERDADGWYKLGCELESSDSEGALKAYCRAVELDPQHADAQINLGRLLHQAGQLDVAEQHYRLALAARPRDAVAHFNLGIAVEDQGRPDEAMKAYLDAIAADAQCGDAYFNLAHLYEQQGMRANAIRYLRTYWAIAKKR
jgi:tetratricopeptide (TPR) repeat protein